MLVFSPLVATDGSWRPDPKFSIEGSTLVETMTFISGASYALTYSDERLRSEGKTNFYCLPSNQVPDSKLLVDLLNKKLQGNQTSETVSKAIVQQLAENFPCK
jgi:hypothetical protein